MSKWIYQNTENKNVPINLICFTFAGGGGGGGGTASYNAWLQNLTKNICLFTLNYPGRGTRYKETRTTYYQQLIKLILKEIKQDNIMKIKKPPTVKTKQIFI